MTDIAGIINHDLIMLSNWAKQWLVKFNPLKTEAVLFTLKNIEALPHFVFDKTIINFVDNHKHLVNFQGSHNEILQALLQKY